MKQGNGVEVRGRWLERAWLGPKSGIPNKPRTWAHALVGPPGPEGRRPSPPATLPPPRAKCRSTASPQTILSSYALSISPSPRPATETDCRISRFAPARTPTRTSNAWSASSDRPTGPGRPPGQGSWLVPCTLTVCSPSSSLCPLLLSVREADDLALGVCAIVGCSMGCRLGVPAEDEGAGLEGPANGRCLPRRSWLLLLALPAGLSCVFCPFCPPYLRPPSHSAPVPHKQVIP